MSGEISLEDHRWWGRDEDKLLPSTLRMLGMTLEQQQRLC